jgi:hypothetical protein
MSTASTTEPGYRANGDAVHSPLPTRLYGMTIVSLAVFFAGLIVWRVPVDGYLAVSEVGRRILVQPGQDDQVAAARSDTGDSQQFSAIHQALADAIRYADARLAHAEPDLVAEVSDERIRSIHSRLTINASKLHARDHSIRISFTGPDPTWSLALVEHLTRDCLVATSLSAESTVRSARALRDARWRLDLTRHYERKARYGVEDLMDMYLARFSETAMNSENGENMSEVGVGASQPTDASAVAELNPQWQQLQTELADMAQQLRPLVKHLTPSHPHILDLTQRMELVRRQLDVTPQYLGSRVSQALGSTATREGAATTQASHVAGVVEGVGEDYQELRKAYEDAIGNREQAEQRLADLVARPLANAEQSDAETRWLITPPTLQGRIGGRPSARRVGAIGLFALFCGACVAWSIGTLQALRRVNTVTDLEQTLSVPVVGQLSIDPVPGSVSPLTRRSRILRGVIMAAEVTLGLMLVVFVSGAIEGSSVPQLLRDDPFTAIPDTVVHALQQWF